MMEKEKINIWSLVLNFILGTLLVVSLIFLFRSCNTSPEVIQIVQKDTITITKDSLITKFKYKTKFDTIREIQYIDTINHDTIMIHDTLEIPIDHLVDSFTIRKDSLTVTELIHYSGYKAKVDSVEMNYEWQYTFLPKKQRKWGLVWFVGPTVTGGVNFNANNKTFDYGPSVGISVGVGIGGVIK